MTSLTRWRHATAAVNWIIAKAEKAGLLRERGHCG